MGYATLLVDQQPNFAPGAARIFHEPMQERNQLVKEDFANRASIYQKLPHLLCDYALDRYQALDRSNLEVENRTESADPGHLNRTIDDDNNSSTGDRLVEGMAGNR